MLLVIHKLTVQSQSIHLASVATSSARNASERQDWAVCVDHATKALEVSPNSAGLRELRLGCETEMGDVNAVYGDLRYGVLRSRLTLAVSPL